ncbi:hypothetical protein GCM10010358_70160 [Streptomyces minutiscleroticus]|uniref:Cas12f1-like TNB domain-containing protein n=1 Tax=Streptomyces minutiscleroticus TaxID=68238 RepID=A0A918U8C8_9ACTN|nr:hypothetical protein GCM10010358_70160 [Streptomyces minutiscleroticus]
MTVTVRVRGFESSRQGGSDPHRFLRDGYACPPRRADALLCSVCGAVQNTMPLGVREWVCGCGAVHDRDVNAAKNILVVGLTASVCGADARPQRSTPGGQSAAKQKPLRREP